MMIDVLARLNLSAGQLADFCRRNHIARLSFFGSVLRDDFRPDSDVDVLVKFANHLPSTFTAYELFDVRDEFARLVGREVDLVEEGATRNPFRRKRIMSTRQVMYEEAA